MFKITSLSLGLSLPVLVGNNSQQEIPANIDGLLRSLQVNESIDIHNVSQRLIGIAKRNTGDAQQIVNKITCPQFCVLLSASCEDNTNPHKLLILLANYPTKVFDFLLCYYCNPQLGFAKNAGFILQNTQLTPDSRVDSLSKSIVGLLQSKHADSNQRIINLLVMFSTNTNLLPKIVDRLVRRGLLVGSLSQHQEEWPWHALQFLAICVHDDRWIQQIVIHVGTEGCITLCNTLWKFIGNNFSENNENCRQMVIKILNALFDLTLECQHTITNSTRQNLHSNQTILDCQRIVVNSAQQNLTLDLVALLMENSSPSYYYRDYLQLLVNATGNQHCRLIIAQYIVNNLGGILNQSTTPSAPMSAYMPYHLLISRLLNYCGNCTIVESTGVNTTIYNKLSTILSTYYNDESNQQQRHTLQIIYYLMLDFCIKSIMGNGDELEPLEKGTNNLTQSINDAISALSDSLMPLLVNNDGTIVTQSVANHNHIAFILFFLKIHKHEITIKDYEVFMAHTNKMIMSATKDLSLSVCIFSYCKILESLMYMHVYLLLSTSPIPQNRSTKSAHDEDGATRFTATIANTHNTIQGLLQQIDKALCDKENELKCSGQLNRANNADILLLKNIVQKLMSQMRSQRETRHLKNE